VNPGLQPSEVPAYLMTLCVCDMLFIGSDINCKFLSVSVARLDSMYRLHG
jgi:hypothetical protein